VVDDEPETVDAVVELIEGEGYATLRAENGRDALRLLHEGARPALILLDLKMPTMDGWEFCRRLGEEEDLAEIPVAVVTASASVERVPERHSDAGFFVKPVNYRRLLEVVRRYCR
jgi:CheY-like chemotaxis protein